MCSVPIEFFKYPMQHKVVISHRVVPWVLTHLSPPHFFFPVKRKGQVVTHNSCHVAINYIIPSYIITRYRKMNMINSIGFALNFIPNVSFFMYSYSYYVSGQRHLSAEMNKLLFGIINIRVGWYLWIPYQ